MATSIKQVKTLTLDQFGLTTSLGIGTTPDSALTVSSQVAKAAPPSGTSIHYIGLDANPLRVTLDTHNTGTSGTAFLGRRSYGTASSPSAVQSGATIITFNGMGYGATGYAAASTGLISIKANQNFTDSAMGTYISLFTTPDGSVTAAESLRVTGAGALNIFQAAGELQINGTQMLTPSNLTVSSHTGGTAVGSQLTLKGTTANGTSTVASIVGNVGNNGATNAFNVYNDGQFLIGSSTRNPAAGLGILRIGQSTSLIDIGDNGSGVGAIWINQATPATTNYSLKASSTTTTINGGGGTLNIGTVNITRCAVGTNTFVFTAGAATSSNPVPYTFTTPGSTTQSGETIGFDWDLATNNIQHASNTGIATNRDHYFRGRNHRFQTATGTITDGYTAYFDVPVAGTNAVITNIWAAGFNGNVNLLAKTKFGTGVIADGGGLKHARVTTGSVSAGSTDLVTITWTTAFADANYTVQASVLEATTSSLSMSVVHIESITASAVTVRVINNAVGALTGTVQVIAIHD